MAIRRVPEHRDYIVKTSIEYGVTVLNSTSTAQNITLTDVPTGWVVKSITAELVSQFNGVALATLILKIGTAAVADTYLADFNLMQTLTSTSISSQGMKVAAIGNHDIVARLISTGASINAISAGRVDITIVTSPN